jgi:hypothetical protein
MQRHLRITNITGKKHKFKCNTGFLPLEERVRLIDFLSSHTVWWKTDRFGQPGFMAYGLVPIVLSPGSFRYDTTDEDIVNVEFEFEIAR